MSYAQELPSRVRFNRGLGWVFWMAFGIVTFVALAALVGEWEDAGAFLSIFMFVVTVGILLVVRWLQAPRVSFDFARGEIKRRSKVTQFSEVTTMVVRNERRAGYWIMIYAGRKNAARVSVSEGFCRNMNEQQWLAIRHFIALKLQMHAGTVPGQYELPPMVQYIDPVKSIQPLQALHLVDQQLQWMASGRRGSSSKAPWNDMVGKMMLF